ncbi:DUF6212 domain-containing protein [Roseomonas sp. 18066]|uniref:DUF6212 domain-containing protein n=1 Tax=Roseomonas sp. 18066 TaxID=2681412 RepID=UPI00135AA817|nr:DUF6212 domain-containing protein [Roseomonas sp. 18066]
MISFHAAPADLAALAGGGPALVLPAGLPQAEILAGTGLVLWWAALLPGSAVWLRRDAAPSTPPDNLLPLDLPPAGLLAVIARDADRLAAWAGWWQALGQEPPRLIAAASAIEAWPALAEALVAELAAATDRAGLLQQAQVALRQDHEETRAALGALARQLAHRPPAAPRLALSTEPGAEALAARDGALRLRQPLGLRLDALTRIGLHLASVGQGFLRIRLIGAESDRVQGSWLVPLDGLAPGWLLLDLPAPLPALAETAMLSLQAEGADRLALSLDAGWTRPAGAVRAEDAPAPADRALALRAWTAEPGSRFTAPAHWRWDEPGLALPEPGLPYALAEAGWPLARALSGSVSLLGLGDEAPRALLRTPTTGPGQAVLHLPHLHNAGLAVLRLTAALRQGAAADLALAAWILPSHQGIATPADLAPRDAAGRFSGWRGFAGDGSLQLALTLPLALGLNSQLVVALATREGGAAPAGCAVELTALEFIADGDSDQLALRIAASPARGLPPPPPPPVAPVVEETPEPTTSLPAIASLEAVMLNQYYPPRGQSDYRHLDLTVMSLAIGAQRWPGVRLKLSISGGRPQLEFRQAAGHPEVFAQWLPTGEDKFGAFIRLGLAELPGYLARPETLPRDRLLLRTLLQLMPGATAKAVSAAGLPPEEMLGWLEAARALAGLAEAGASRDDAATRLGGVPAAQHPAVIENRPPVTPPVVPPAAAPAAPPPAPVAAPPPEPLPAATGGLQPAADRDALPGAPPTVEKLLLNQHFAGTGDYRHLDVTLLELAAGGARWPLVRLKLGRTSRGESLEFRQSQGWPHAFARWKSTGEDKFGPFARLAAANLADYHSSLDDPADRALLTALLAALPAMMVEAGHAAGFDAATIADWQEAARRLTALLPG